MWNKLTLQIFTYVPILAIALLLIIIYDIADFKEKKKNSDNSFLKSFQFFNDK